jgi:outer membrane protein assembly factor BamA
MLVVTLAGVVLFADSAAAVLLDALDPAHQWKVERIEFSGNNTVSTGELSNVILTKARPWYRFWEERPIIDAVTFASDLEKLQPF